MGQHYFQAVFDLTMHLEEIGSVRSILLTNTIRGTEYDRPDDSFRLRLNTTNGAEHSDHTIEHTHGALHLTKSTTQGINDVDPVVLP